MPKTSLYRYFHNQLETRRIDEIGDLIDLWDNKTIPIDSSISSL